MTKFKYVSMFSGIGGFEQALNKHGGKCVLASEIDKFANQAYEALYGESTSGDITKIAAEDVPDHDLLVGGFPCQAFSVAGKRGGFEDSRGTLFFEIARIASVKQPRALLLENVKGLVGHDKGRTLDTIVQTLNDIGYTVDFDVLNSKYFGVPQNRERIFIIAVRDDLVTQEPWIIEGNTVVPKGKRRISAYEGVKTFNFDFPANTEVTTRLHDVLEAQVDEKYYLSEEKTAALVAQLESDESVRANSDNCEMVGMVDLRGNESIRRVYTPTGVAPTLTTMDGGHQEPKIAELQGVQMNRHKIAGITDISHCLMARDYKGFGNQDMTGVIVGLPIREATKIGYTVAAVGDAVNFQFPESKTRRGRVGKQIANTLEASTINQGVVEAEEVRPVLTPDRAEKRQNGRRFKEDGEESFTLTAQDKHGVAIGQAPKYRIRKLTPLECWRLQGFSDEAHQTVVDAGISDSQRYKQAGNAVTVNVIAAIGERLIPYLSR